MRAGRLRTIPLALGSALVIAVGVGFPGTATAKPTPPASYEADHPKAAPSGYANWEALYAMQNRLDAAADDIRAAAGDLDASGYSSVYISTETRELVLYWKGVVPASVDAAIAQQRGTVKVRVVPAKYSEGELVRERDRIAAEAVDTQVKLTEFGPMPDGSGLRVRYAMNSAAPVSGRAQAMSASALTAAVPALASSPVDLIVEAPSASATPNLWDRFNDSPGYYGGARTTNCTTGFALNSLGESRIAYAAHCPQGNVYDGGGDLIGATALPNATRDIMIIRASSLARVWDGGIHASVSKPVQSGVTSNVGDWLCTSGSFSGTLCNIRVVAINQNFLGASPLVVAENQAHTAAGGNGDSGGPVFSLPSPDNGAIIAKGIISRGDQNTTVPCPGVPSGPDRFCAWRFGYADLVQSLPYLGSNLKTWP